MNVHASLAELQRLARGLRDPRIAMKEFLRPRNDQEKFELLREEFPGWTESEIGEELDRGRTLPGRQGA